MSAAEMTIDIADELLERIGEQTAITKKYEDERDALINRYEQKIFCAKEICARNCHEAREAIDNYTEQLKGFAERNLPKGKKTLKLPSGKMSFHKQQPKFYFDDYAEVSGFDARLIEFCKLNAPEYINQKITETADWLKLKKRLIVDGQDVYLSETGQQIEGMHVEILPDKFTVDC